MRKHLDHIADSTQFERANSGFGMAMLVMIQMLFIYAFLAMLAEKPRAYSTPVHLHQQSNLHGRNNNSSNLVQRQAQAYKALYDIGDKDIISAINIFGE